MPEVRFFFSEIRVLIQDDQGTERLLVTPSENRNFIDVVNNWKQSLVLGQVPVYSLPERKQNRRGEKVYRKILIPHIENHQDEIFIFHIWKVTSDIGDTLIVNTDDTGERVIVEAQSIRDLVKLSESRGAVTHSVCAYDIKNNILCWRDIEGVSRREIENLFRQELDRKVELVLLNDPNVEEDFDRINIDQLNLDILISDWDSAVTALDLKDDDRPLAAQKLKEAAQEFGGYRLKLTLYAEKGKTAERLRKDVIDKSRPTLLAALARMNIGRLGRRRGRLSVEGPMPSDKQYNIFENRVIDLFEGILIRKEEYIEGSSIEELFKNINLATIKAVHSGRRVYEIKIEE